MRGAVRWLVVIVIIAIAVRYTLPRLKLHRASTTTESHSSCASAADRASETWGSGLHRFANPPYDIAAWNDFRANVESQISEAEKCESVRGAMRDLRALVGECDTAIRNGSPPPSDFVQRQEAIDNAIAAAK